MVVARMKGFLRSRPIVHWLVAVFVLGGVLAGVAESLILRAGGEVAVGQLAERQAEARAKEAFASVYAAMLRGGAHDDFAEVIAAQNHTGQPGTVHLVRGESVNRQYGPPAEVSSLRNEPTVRAAFATGKPRMEVARGLARASFPLVLKAECADCHEGRVGETVNGVVSVRMPLEALREPFTRLFNQVLIAFLATLGVVFVLLFAAVNFLIVKPIHELADTMGADTMGGDTMGRISEITGGGDQGGRRVPYTQETRRLVSSFRALMRRIADQHLTLQAMARQDPLTGLPNRLILEERLDQEIDRSDRHRHRFALLFVDLDGFKEINDSAGHALGDRVLIDVARLLEGCCRSLDVVARLGGDEFVIMLSEPIDPATATEVATKILSALGACSWEGRGVGASIGVAVWPDHARSRLDLMAAADKAMYAAKKSGKGVVRLAR